MPILLEAIISCRYVSDIAAKNLLTYKYSGTDHSLLYKYIFSPLAQLVVDKVLPEWLAPNVITLIGVFCTIIPHIIIWSMYPESFSGSIPSWFCFLAAIGQFVYMILDNADGKQARKTGNSSPLGLLFDHGCDAFNTFIAGMTLFSIVQFGNSVYTLIAYLTCLIPFYMATWEEYYTNHLTLPIINGPNEGIVGIIGLLVFSGIFGNHIWVEKAGGIPINLLALCFFIVLSVANSAINLMAVVKQTKENAPKALRNLSMLGYIIITSLIVGTLSPTDVVSRKARSLIYLIGLAFSKLMGHLQVSHVTQEKFEQYQWSVVLPLTLLNLNTLYGYIQGSAFFNEDLFVDALCIFILLAYLHYAISVVLEFSKALGIYVFKVGKRQPKKLE